MAIAFKRKKISALVLIALSSMASVATAQTVNLGTVGGSSGATSNENVYAAKGTAASVAPTQANLNATEPQSVISRSFIEESTPPTGNLNTIISIAPSIASSASPNGPGLMDTKSTMRGFQDGEYNITFDGIPFGDTNGPTHHSTSYFPASIIGGVVIERGPGNASNIGYSTYGGSVNLFSKTPSETQSTSVFGSYGTWNSSLLGFSYESGRMQDSDATLQLDAQQLSSDGYLTDAFIDGKTLSAKYQRPVGTATLLTLYSAFSHVVTNQPDNITGATYAQQNKLGLNYYLNNNPKSQGYYNFNFQDKTTDLEYLRLQSHLDGGWELDNTLYTYKYWNQTVAGQNPGNYNGTTDSTYNVKNLNGTTAAIVPAGDVPGYFKLNGYRVWGDNFKVTRKFGEDLLKTGVWYEMNNTNRHNLEADLSTGSMLAGVTSTSTGNNQPGVVTSSNFAEQYSGRHAVQPYVEYEWTAAPGLKVTPGFKYMTETDDVSSLMNQKSQLNQSYSYTYNAALPYLTLNQKFGEQNAAYAQFAKGMQVIGQSVALGGYSSTNGSQPDPELTTNYQLGWVHKEDKLLYDADVYYIDVNNLYINQGTATNPLMTNSGGAVYQGIEAQITWSMNTQWAVYANASGNSAQFKAGNISIAGASIGDVPMAPRFTAALGLMYQEGPWAGNLMYKVVGDQLASTSYGNYPAVENLDLNISYTIKNFQSRKDHDLRMELSVFNLTNKQTLIYASSSTVAAGTTYQYQAPTSAMFTIKADF